MSSALIAGTFATGSLTAGLADQVSGAITIPFLQSGFIYLSAGGDIDASNSIRLQKTTTPGGAWTTAATYVTAQNALGVAVVAGEQYRIITVAMQAMKSITYKLTCES